LPVRELMVRVTAPDLRTSESDGGVSLAEGDTVFAAGDGGGLLFQPLDQRWIGDKCRRIEVHGHPPSIETGRKERQMQQKEDSPPLHLNAPPEE
jgi:hypothetical protein